MRYHNINNYPQIDPRNNKFINNSSLILPQMQQTHVELPDSQFSTMNKPMINFKQILDTGHNYQTMNGEMRNSMIDSH